MNSKFILPGSNSGFKLKFFYVILFSLIPYNVFTLSYELYYLLFQQSKLNVGFIVFDSIVTILLIISFFGLFKLRKIGYLCLLCSFTISLILSIVNILNGNVSEIFIFDLVVNSLKLIVVFFYFHKRRGLFK